jgi:hypothetical protein
LTKLLLALPAASVKLSGSSGYRGFRAVRFFSGAGVGRERAAAARSNCTRRRGAAKSNSARNFSGSLP